jgi:Acetyltransferase (GNAT) family
VTGSSGFPELAGLAPAHAAQAARLFLQISPAYLLSRLGERFLAEVFWRPFYSGGPDFGYVWVRDGRVVGLAAGTTQRTGLVGRTIRGAPVGFVHGVARGVLRSPGVIGEGLDLIRRLRHEEHESGPEAELITLGLLPRDAHPAVSPATGQRVSPAVVLLRACAARMQAQGATEFRLYTAVRNHLACALYRRLGFSEARRFQLFGEERICFVRSTSFSDPL